MIINEQEFKIPIHDLTTIKGGNNGHWIWDRITNNWIWVGTPKVTD